MSIIEFGVPTPAPAFGANGLKLNATNYQWVHTLAANPLIRPDGSPLISGDRIYDTTTGEAWWWNGTLWLSHEFQSQSWVNNFTNTITVNTLVDTPIGRDVFVKEVIYSFSPSNNITTTAANTITSVLRTLGPTGVIVSNQTLPVGTVFNTGVRTAIKPSVGVTASVRTLGAAASGIALASTNTTGFTLNSCSFGLRWALVR
jgi:hypothetical protein